MTNTETFESLLEEDRKASDEIRRLKETERLRVLSSPGSDTAGLESAIEYWVQRKREIDDKMRQLR